MVKTGSCLLYPLVIATLCIGLLKTESLESVPEGTEDAAPEGGGDPGDLPGTDAESEAVPVPVPSTPPLNLPAITTKVPVTEKSGTKDLRAGMHNWLLLLSGVTAVFASL